MQPHAPADGDAHADDAPIVPLAYAPPEAVAAAPARRLQRHHLGIALALLPVLLLAWFLLSARALRIETLPADASLSVSGGLHLRFGSNVLLRPGDYTVTARAEGYATREVATAVGADAGATLRIELEKLPGRLALRTTPVAARVFIDGRAVGESNGAELRIAAGTHTVRLEADRFLPLEQPLEVTGMDRRQELALTLAPGWGNYRIETDPPGASVLLDAATLGTTPGVVELMAGARTIRLQLAGYRDVPLVVEAKAGETRTLDPVRLQRADARLLIASRPPGATVTLDGVFQGSTPLAVAVDSSTAHEIVAFRTGYEPVTRRVPAGRSGEQSIDLVLPPLLGNITLKVVPDDAEIVVGGSVRARGSATLALTAVPQLISVRSAGYETQEIKVTPRPGLTQTLAVRLQTAEQKKLAGISQRISTRSGQELVLLRPTRFTLGSSRREPGRRANEVLHDVVLKRPFYLGVAEVGNAEFRRYQPTHSSGNFKGKSLNGEDQPVAKVSWDEAALYCNWLSKQEGLRPFYLTEEGVITGMDATSTGYRLPTEAEWAWAATVSASGAQQRFPWGPEMPPPARAGNFADRSGAELLGEVIAGYDDGFAVAAPRKRFGADRHGVFDLAGNAAEWVNDYYDAARGSDGGGETDPVGPEMGEFHVIRGASWRSGTAAELRNAWRDYGKDGRPDVGFRIARYLE